MFVTYPLGRAPTSVTGENGVNTTVVVDAVSPRQLSINRFLLIELQPSCAS